MLPCNLPASDMKTKGRERKGLREGKTLQWCKSYAAVVVMSWSKTIRKEEITLTRSHSNLAGEIMTVFRNWQINISTRFLRQCENIHLPLNLWGMFQHFSLTNLPTETIWTHLSLCIQIGLNCVGKGWLYLSRDAAPVCLSGRHALPADLASFKWRRNAECKADLSQQNNRQHVRCLLCLKQLSQEECLQGTKVRKVMCCYCSIASE